MRYYQASSSEQFGKVVETLQKETTRFYPRSPLRLREDDGALGLVNYRESMACTPRAASCSTTSLPPRRDLRDPARSPAPSAASSSACRTRSSWATSTASDWGFAGDYVKMMDDAQRRSPTTTSLPPARRSPSSEFSGVQPCGLDYKDFVAFDPRYLRPAEVDLLLGDPSKAKAKLYWVPQTTVETARGHDGG